MAKYRLSATTKNDASRESSHAEPVGAANLRTLTLGPASPAVGRLLDEVEVCGETGECAEMSFQFVPRQSKRQGTVGFSRDPGKRLTHRVTGYRIP